MAEPESGSVAAEGHPETHGNRLVAAFKRIKPGEWILIGIGVVGLIVYFVWYRNQQSSGTADALTPAGGTSNPWATSAVDPAQLDSDIQALTAAIQAGVATTPGTSAAAGGSSAGGSGSSSEGGSTTTVKAPASSGSGISQASNNQAPVANITQMVQAAPQNTAAPQPTAAQVSAAQAQSIAHPSVAARRTIATYTVQQPYHVMGATDATATFHPVRGVNPAA